MFAGSVQTLLWFLLKKKLSDCCCKATAQVVYVAVSVAPKLILSIAVNPVPRQTCFHQKIEIFFLLNTSTVLTFFKFTKLCKNI